MKRTLVTLAVAASLGAASTPVLAADFSANIGWNSQYIYRGIFQSKSSAMAGVDMEAGGFYLGAWGADVDDGVEIDYYGGYNFDLGPVSLGVGGTLYTYTGDFDDTYQEINLGGAFAGLSLDVAIGEYDNFTGPTLDYTYAALTYEYEGFYGTYGTFSQDFDGSYIQLGYGTTIAEIDFGVALILADDDLLGGEDDESLIFSIGKSFDLRPRYTGREASRPAHLNLLARGIHS